MVIGKGYFMFTNLLSSNSGLLVKILPWLQYQLISNIQ